MFVSFYILFKCCRGCVLSLLILRVAFVCCSISGSQLQSHVSVAVDEKPVGKHLII